MSINDFRFRNEGELVVLQVLSANSYEYGGYHRQGEWRDAKTQDLIDVADLLRNKYRSVEYVNVETPMSKSMPGSP